MRQKNKREGLTSVQIRPQITKRLAYFIKQGMSKSEIINQALHEYLIDREIEEMRKRLIPYAQAKGIYTEEDVDRVLGE